MTFNTKILAGALALVLVAGMTSPAFAGTNPECTIEPAMAILEITQEDGSDFVEKVVTCTVTILDVDVLSDTCENYDASIIEDSFPLPNVAQITEQVTNFSPLISEHCIVIFEVNLDGPFEAIQLTQELWINQQQVAGELLPLDSTALLIGGLSSMSVWMIPSIAGIAGAAVYLVKYRANKE